MDKVTIMGRKRFLDLFQKNKLLTLGLVDREPVKDTASKRYLDTLALAFYDEWTFADEIDLSTPEDSNRLT